MSDMKIAGRQNSERKEGYVDFFLSLQNDESWELDNKHHSLVFQQLHS